MVLQTFCGLLSLQVGMVNLSCVFWLLGGVITVTNILDIFEASAFPVFGILILLTLVALVVTGLALLQAAYKESQQLCTVSMALLVLFTLFWLVACALSFYNDPDLINYVCIKKRCPESFWVVTLDYRKQDHPGDYVNASNPPASTAPATGSTDIADSATVSIGYDYTGESEETTGQGTAATSAGRVTGSETERTLAASTGEVTPRETEGTPGAVSGKLSDNFVDFFVELHTEAGDRDEYGETGKSPDDAEGKRTEVTTFYNEGTTSPAREVGEGGYYFGVHMFMAVLLFIMNFVFFLFALVVVWSYKSELQWSDQFLQEMEEDDV